MSRLKRYYNENQTYFVTNVTHNRHPLLKFNYDLLRRALDTVEERLGFDLHAFVFMPEHFHAIITPSGYDLSDIMHRIKLSFGSMYRKRYRLRGGRIWQARFWDHIIHDQEDMNRHIDYIHYNPVHHGLLKSPFDHRYSSLHTYSEAGYYSSDWGVEDTPIFDGAFGDD